MRIRTREVVLLGLLALLPTAITADQVWVTAKVAETSLSNARFEGQISSKVRCAAIDTEADLFCYENGQCSTYNVKVSGFHDDTPGGSVSSCWTKHDCVLEGVGYQQNEEFEYDCQLTLCKKYNEIIFSPLVPDRPSCTSPFFLVNGNECITIVNIPSNWCDARLYCMNTYGADLAVTTNWNGFRQYMEAMPLTSDPWVGVISMTWLDGRAVTQSEWASHAPNDGANACSRIIIYGGTLYLDDVGCGNTKRFVCQLDIP